MRRGLLTLIIGLFVAFPLLNPSMDIEEQGFITTVGVDLLENGHIQLSVQMPEASVNSPSSESQEQTQAQSDSKYQYAVASGENVYVAMSVLDASTPQHINFTQVYEVVLSLAVAQSERLPEVLEQLMGLPGMRISAYLIVVGGEATTFLQHQLPYLTTERLSKHIETLMRTYDDQGQLILARLSDIAFGINTDWHDIALPYGAVNDGSQPEIPARVMDQMAGTLTRKSDSKTEMLGVVILNGSRAACMLTGLETRWLSFLLKEMETFPYYAADQFVYIRNIGTSILLDTATAPWTIRVECRPLITKVGLIPPPSSAVVEAIEADLRALIEKLQAAGVDPLGLEGRLATRFFTMEQKERVDFRAQYQQAALSLTVNATVLDER